MGIPTVNSATKEDDTRNEDAKKSHNDCSSKGVVLENVPMVFSPDTHAQIRKDQHFLYEDPEDVEMGHNPSGKSPPSDENLNEPIYHNQEEGSAQPIRLQRHSAVRTVEPGAVRVYPTGFQDGDTDDDDDSSQASDLLSNEDNAVLDENDTLVNQEEAIQGVLVNNREEEEHEIQQQILGEMEYATARILLNQKEKLNQRIKYGLLMFLLAIAIIIVSVVVSVGNNQESNDGSVSPPFSRASSSSPAISLAPSIQPSHAPSQGPSEIPSSSPTQMSWVPLQDGFVVGQDNEDPILPPPEFARDVAVVAIQNETSNDSETTVMIASTYLYSHLTMEFIFCTSQACTTGGHILRQEDFIIDTVVQIAISPDAQWLALMAYQLGAFQELYDPVVLLYNLQADNIDLTQQLPLNMTPVEISHPQISNPNMNLRADIVFGQDFLAVLGDRVVVYSTNVASDFNELDVLLDWSPNDEANRTAGLMAYEPILMAASADSSILADGCNLNEFDAFGIFQHINVGFRLYLFDINAGALLHTRTNTNFVAFLSRQSIALSADGNVLALAYSFHEDGGIRTPGSPFVEVLERHNETEWIQRGQILTEVETSGFGRSLELNHDGSMLIVGAHTFRRTTDGFDVETGAVITFEFNGDEWIPFGAPESLLGTTGSLFGNSIAITPESDFLVVAAPRHLGGIGATQIFHQVGV